jgi:hypothetical protein
MSKLFTKFANWFLSTQFWRWVARKHIAYFTFRFYGYPKLPMESYFEIKDILRKDPNAFYAFVSADKESLAWRLTHWMTRAQWGHAGILYLDGFQVRVSHMKGDGLNDWNLLDLLRECDCFAVVKMPFKDPATGFEKFKKRYEIIKSSPSVEYDFPLSLDHQIHNWVINGDDPPPTFKLYCSEYVYVLGENLVEGCNFKAKEFSGRLVFEPDDVYKAGHVLFEYVHH